MAQYDWARPPQKTLVDALQQRPRRFVKVCLKLELPQSYPVKKVLGEVLAKRIISKWD